MLTTFTGMSFDAIWRRSAAYVVLAVILCAILVLVGWFFNIDLLKSIVHGAQTMKPNTAVCFILTALALGCYLHAGRSPGLFLCSALVALIAGATLSEYLFGWNLGIDQLLFHDNSRHQGRMAIITAINFLLLAAALVLLERPQPLISTAGLTVFVFLTSFVALVGYIYDVNALHSFVAYTSISIHTAVLFFWLTLALFVSAPDTGRSFSYFFVNRDNGGLMSRSLFWRVLVLPVVLGWLILSGVRDGNYGFEFGFAMLTVLTMFLLSIALWQEARSLHGSEAERRKVEAVNAWQQIILNSADLLIISTDISGQITSCNAGGLRTLGYDAEELHGMALTMLHEPEELRRLAREQGWPVDDSQAFAILSGSSGSDSRDWTYYSKAGQALTMNIAISRLEDKQQKLTGFLIVGKDFTMRRQQEQEISLLSERLRLATDSVGMGIWDWSMEREQLVWDQRMRELYGAPAGLTPTYDWWRQRLHPEDIDAMESILDAVSTSGASFNSQFRIVLPEKGIRYIQTAGIVVRNEHKQAVRMVGVNFDISLQKEAEMLREQARSELQIIIDYMPSIISYWDKSLRNRFANKGCLDWFGLSVEQMRGRSMLDLMGNNYQERKPYIDGVLAGKDQQFDIFMIDRFGKGHYFLVSYIPDWQHGQVQGFYVFITDYTQLKQAQLAEAKAQSLLQGVVDAASEYSIIATDLDGVIRLFSKGSERMLGYSAEDMVGKVTPAILHRPDEVEQLSRQLSAETGEDIHGFEVFVHRARQGYAETREWTYIDKDGKQFPVLLVVTAVRNDEQEISGFVGIAKDISEQRRIQRELMHAKDQAEQASRAKTEFVANMSHEIRTPMNAVLGMSYLLANTPLTMEQKKYLDMIQVSGQTLLGILNDILDFSKIEAGKMTLSPVDFQLDEALNALASMMTVNAGQKDLELAIGVDADVPQMLFGDALRLQQILVNLTGNAIKFTETGEVVVTVSLVEQHEQRVRLRFVIRDTGIGMTAEQIGTLFHAFAQVDGSITRRFGGTGLGLTICKRLVEMMDGEIGVRSTPGQGSEFFFTVTLRQSAQALPVNRKSSMGSLHLLIVDDNSTTRSFLDHMIQSWGWRATLAASGEEAVSLLNDELAAGHHYDAVLTDWQMPGMDGLAVALAVKAAQQRSRLPVMIMVSAFGRDALMHQKGIDQIDGILIKPVTSSSLYDTLHEALMQRRGQIGVQRLAANPPGQRLDGARLLLVEDNPLNQLVARNILAQAGAEIDVVGDGQQALARLRERPEYYHLVLMDVQMPVLDGFSATRQIRQTLQLTIPVLAMTAGVMENERSQCLASGMNGFIAKPLDVEEMLHAIRQQLPATVFAPTLQDNHDSRRDEPEMNPLPAVNAGMAVIFNGAAFLQVVGGDESLQYELTEQFVDNYRRAAADISQALAAGDMDAASRLLHTLKGLSGTFKAERLAQAALVLEEELLERRTVSAEQLATFDASLQATVTAMEQWLAEHPQTPAASVDNGLNEAELEQLLALLAQNNMSAFDVYATLHGALAARVPSAELASLDSAMNRLDFAKARTLLVQWRQQQSH